MPFGLSNPLASYQGYINKIFAEKLNIFVVIYLNNILIDTEDPEQPHVEEVQWVLGQLQKHSLYVNMKKCRFHKDEIKFLHFVVLAQRIRIEEEKIETIRDWLES